jgi:hypothetical protein
MGYFDGLVEAAFKTDQAGNTVFYPWGVAGRGRVLKDPAVIDALRRFMRMWYQVMFTVVILFSVSISLKSVGGPVVIGGAIVYLVVFMGWFFLRTRKLLSGAEFSDERLTMRTSHTNMAAKLSRPMLWGFLALSLLFVVIGIWMTFRVGTTTGVVQGVATAGLFAILGSMFGWFLIVKSRSPPSEP